MHHLNEGLTILEVARQLGIFIPTLCHVKGLEPYGSCWVCVVEQIAPVRRIVPACATKITDGMVIETDNETVKHTRKMALELLLSDHFGDCIAPCTLRGCPAQIDIEGFLAFEAKGQYREAADLIRKQAPLPEILGWVCPRPCEKVCRRNRVDESVRIGIQKRFIAEQESLLGGPFLPTPRPATGKRVAIVGAGPAGITCAYYLALEGHEITIYEEKSRHGGMLRYGIPDYRLPQSVLDREFSCILSHFGIQVNYNSRVGRDQLTEMRSRFDAIVLTIGAQNSSEMGIEGEMLPGVYSALTVLEHLADHHPISLGQETLVIGGGFTAMDVARSSVRQGVSTTVLYRRNAEEMPAKHEIDDATQEGVLWAFQVAPVRIELAEGRLRVGCVRMSMSASDEKGRKRPIPIEGSEFDLVVDSVVTAIGQKVDPLLFNDQPDPHVFSAGDCVTGPDLVVTAVASARRVSRSVHQFLSGIPVEGEPTLFSSECGDLSSLPDEMFERFQKLPSQPVPCADLVLRQTTFDPIEQSMSETDIRLEASRCLCCGCVKVHDCRLKDYSEMYKAEPTRYAGERRTYDKDFSHPMITLENDKCITCGACVRVCEERKQFYIFGYTNRGFNSRIKPEFVHPLGETACDGCGQCVEVCPTASIMFSTTSKP